MSLKYEPASKPLLTWRATPRESLERQEEVHPPPRRLIQTIHKLTSSLCGTNLSIWTYGRRALMTWRATHRESLQRQEKVHAVHQPPGPNAKPLSSEHELNKTVKARFWPWLSGKIP